MSSKGGGRSSKFRLFNVAVFGRDLSNNMQLPGAASRCAGDGDCEAWFQQSVHGVWREEEGIDWKSGGGEEKRERQREGQGLLGSVNSYFALGSGAGMRILTQPSPPMLLSTTSRSPVVSPRFAFELQDRPSSSE